MGTPNFCFLPRAPSYLVTPLSLIVSFCGGWRFIYWATRTIVGFRPNPSWRPIVHRRAEPKKNIWGKYRSWPQSSGLAPLLCNIYRNGQPTDDVTRCFLLRKRFVHKVTRQHFRSRWRKPQNCKIYRQNTTSITISSQMSPRPNCVLFNSEIKRPHDISQWTGLELH